MQDPASPQKVLRDRGTNLKVAEFTTFPVSVFSCEVIAGGVEAVGSAAKAGTEMATAIIRESAKDKNFFMSIAPFVYYFFEGYF